MIRLPLTFLPLRDCVVDSDVHCKSDLIDEAICSSIGAAASSANFDDTRA